MAFVALLITDRQDIYSGNWLVTRQTLCETAQRAEGKEIQEIAYS